MGVEPTACGLGVRARVAPKSWDPTTFIVPYTPAEAALVME